MARWSKTGQFLSLRIDQNWKKFQIAFNPYLIVIGKLTFHPVVSACQSFQLY